MSSVNIPEECVYREDRGIDYYAYRLAIMLSSRGSGGSGYRYTKEVRSAIERIINELDWLPDKRAWLSLITQSEAPEDIAPCEKAALCLVSIFEALLKKFRDNALKLPLGMRQIYANILVSAIERTARFPSNLPKDYLEFKDRFFSFCRNENEGGDVK
ncbi:MAG: hypothetical protein G5Z42_01170 [Caldisphaeraceae archaeon]|nr:hypothetical protein [Caldisphaeraceae archaeon]